MRSLLTAAALCAGLLTLTVGAQTLRAPEPRPLLQVRGAETPVRLQKALVRVDAASGVARTTLDLTFRNPNARVLEGSLEFPLQPGQQVTAFALDVDGVMREAVPVEKDRGRQVFEAIERRGADPGLLEQTAGDFFRLRIYPLPPGGERRVRISLMEPMQREGQQWTMRLPLQFAASLSALDLELHSAQPMRIDNLLRATDAHLPQGERLHLSRDAFNSDRGLVLRMAADVRPSVQRQTVDGATYFHAEIPVDANSVRRTLPARMGLLWDASMSGDKRAHDLEFALLDRYFAAAQNVDVRLRLLRDMPEAVRVFQVRNGQWQALHDALAAVRYDGATSAGGWTPDADVSEYLLFGDGQFNYGAEPFPAFSATQRLFAVQAGAGDSARLAALTAAHHGALVTLNDSGSLQSAANALLTDAPRLVSLQAIGASDVVAESDNVRDGVLRVAGRLLEPNATLQLRIAAAGREQPMTVNLADATDGALPSLLWARYTLAALGAEPERNAGAISALGRKFGLVTSQTSLIVLERVEDYLRYDITPPKELRAEFDRLRSERDTDRAQQRQARLDNVAAQWAERTEWWERKFPKDRPAPSKEMPVPVAVAAAAEARARDEDAQASQARNEADAERSAAMRMAAAEPAPAPAMAGPPPPPAPAAPPAMSLDRVEVTGSRIREGSSEETTASIQLQPWQPDSPYAQRLRAAAADDVYSLYLDERARASQGTAFYLDVADVLLEKKRPALAMRVLSNLAEMELDNRHVLRVLGYRLMQAGRADLAVPVLQRVRDMGKEEPQSYRDLALAYAATGERQRALDAFYEVVSGDWDGRFPGVAQIALAELNALVATSPKPLDTHAVDPRLLHNLPVGLRTVLSWDSDNSDMDLWVTDPDGEKVYYAHRLSYQGGRISNDFTGGYGPEEFVLRAPKRGTYKVEANFFGDRQQLVTGATTLQLWLSTGFGTKKQVDQRVTLRLKDRKETVLVGQFEVK